MAAFLRKYATATATGTHVGIPMPKAGSADFAVSADWVPAAGDVKVSIDSGAEANITTLPTYTNGWWIFQLSAAELTGKSIRVKVVDSATKAVDDQAFLIETYGNASALHPFDLGTASTPQTGDVFVRLGAPVAASISADIAGVRADTGNIQTRLPAALVSGRMDASVGAMAANTLTASALAADAVTEIQAGLTPLDAAGVRAAVGLATANLDAQLTNINTKTTNLPAAPAAVGDIPTVPQIWTTALAEAYRATNSTGTGAQLLYEILQNITEFAIAGTTKTAKKLDGTTTAKTYTLSDATNPTSITETT
jgi:hypothetical protein